MIINLLIHFYTIHFYTINNLNLLEFFVFSFLIDLIQFSIDLK
jgi:hypothetical protein